MYPNLYLLFLLFLLFLHHISDTTTYGQNNNKVQEIEKTIYNIRLIAQEEEREANANRRRHSGHHHVERDEDRETNEDYVTNEEQDDDLGDDIFGDDEEDQEGEDERQNGTRLEGTLTTSKNEDSEGSETTEASEELDQHSNRKVLRVVPHSNNNNNNINSDILTDGGSGGGEGSDFKVHHGPPSDKDFPTAKSSLSLDDLQSAINDLGIALLPLSPHVSSSLPCSPHFSYVRTTDSKLVESEVELVSYQVVVHTGNIRGAGTDASIFITIFGENVCSHLFTHSFLRFIQLMRVYLGGQWRKGPGQCC